jgi:hypothetical protein
MQIVSLDNDARQIQEQACKIMIGHLCSGFHGKKRGERASAVQCVTSPLFVSAANLRR